MLGCCSATIAVWIAFVGGGKYACASGGGGAFVVAVAVVSGGGGFSQAAAAAAAVAHTAKTLQILLIQMNAKYSQIFCQTIEIWHICEVCAISCGHSCVMTDDDTN